MNPIISECQKKWNLHSGCFTLSCPFNISLILITASVHSLWCSGHVPLLNPQVANITLVSFSYDIMKKTNYSVNLSWIYKLFRVFHFHLAVSNKNVNGLAHLQEQKLRVYGKLAVALCLSVQCDQAVGTDTDELQCIRTPRNFLWDTVHLSVESQAFKKFTDLFLTFILARHVHACGNRCSKNWIHKSKRK